MPRLTSFNSASRPIVDKNDRVVAVLVSKLQDPGYTASCKRVEALMGREGGAAKFTVQDTVHKRGLFPAVNAGITHGQGGGSPVNLKSDHAETLNRLLQDVDVQRLASAADSGFASWAPELYKHYHERLSRLWASHPNLHRNFSRSVYPTAAFNFGPRVRTYQHRDHLNCPYGWCAVQALGNFNPKEGGHLILWELKLVVEFPAHSLILLPSAAVTHSNTAVKESETRFSFTQYCPGALFRYIDNGMMTDKDLRQKDKTLYEGRMLERQTRWSKCVELLPTLKSLGIAPA
ncbi:hypothetical protein BDN72DRAFT_776013 [Pluteus cervinus]|uniref:Uncharacterized protein n=1 Tax=Pluteus cervinus TaxID=181527 RepID=A0ACD3ACD1_9AGAR|nr:hypothetical protein BDN72DRAFT_776013 [Pluteus cervinus]